MRYIRSEYGKCTYDTTLVPLLRQQLSSGFGDPIFSDSSLSSLSDDMSEPTGSGTSRADFPSQVRIQRSKLSSSLQLQTSGNVRLYHFVKIIPTNYTKCTYVSVQVQTELHSPESKKMDTDREGNVSLTYIYGAPPHESRCTLRRLPQPLCPNLKKPLKQTCSTIKT